MRDNHNIQRDAHHCAWLWAALFTIILAGCAAPPGAKQFHPVFPPPPAPPRFKHILNLHSTADVAAPDFFDQIGQLITGPHSQTLLRPNSVTLDSRGRLVVSDQELQGVHVIDLKTGAAFFIDHVNKTEHFISPVGVAPFGNDLAVADSVRNQVYLFNADGKPIGRLHPDQPFLRPTGLAYDPRHRELYVVDTLANHVLVFDAAGRQVRRFGKRGVEAGSFNYPTHICIGPHGLVYVTDSLNFRVQVFNRQGHYQFDIGKLGDASGSLAVPKGVGVDSFGHIYIVDSYFSNVQVFDRQGRFLLAIGAPGRNSGQFEVPTGLFISPDNRIYVCDSFNHRVQIFQYIGGADHDHGNPPQP